MPQPNVQETQVASYLQDVSIQFKPTGLVCDEVFPIIPNCPNDAKIALYGKGAWFRDEADVRGPGSRAKRGGYPTSYVNVAPLEYAFAKEVTDEDVRAANMAGAPPLQPVQDAIEFATTKVVLKKEILCKALVAGTIWVDGNVGGEDAAGLWAAGAGNTFLVDIATGIKAIHAATGIAPNRLLIDFGTYLSLKEESTILAKIQYTQRGVLTEDLLAAILGLEKVIVAKGSYSTAKENKAGTDFTAAAIWEINATKGMGFLYYAPAAPGLKVPSAGYQARVNLEGGLARRTVTWREPAEHQDVYECAEKVHILAASSSLGYLWKDTLLT